MALYEKGYLPEVQIGRRLNWGDAEALGELTRLTLMRMGFGDQLAKAMTVWLIDMGIRNSLR